MSKNAIKRLRRQEKWEAGKDARRKRRKEKRHELRSRRREERDALVAQGIDPAAQLVPRPPSELVPVALVLDCDFEQYMADKERISLASQLTRSYSDNKQARYKVHLWLSGWKGKLVERFRDVLDDQQKNWKGVTFVEGDFVQCAELSQRQLGENSGRALPPALQRRGPDEQPASSDPRPEAEPEPREEHRNIVYLTADSPHTLSRLEAGATYIIGGLVDKNRMKGLCYKLARERGIRTARLPIGRFLAMQSRQVLATNHVVEIMLKWLEYEDWGKAFMEVIPRRKGGQLIHDRPEDGHQAQGGEEEKQGCEEAAEDGGHDDMTGPHS